MMKTQTESNGLILQDTKRADNLAAKDPQRYQDAVEALNAGEPTRSICKRLHLSASQLQAILSREGIPAWKTRLSKRLGEFVAMATERLAEEVETMPIGQLPVAIGIALDKKAALDGDQPPAVVEHRSIKIELREKFAELTRFLEPHSGPTVDEKP